MNCHSVTVCVWTMCGQMKCGHMPTKVYTCTIYIYPLICLQPKHINIWLNISVAIHVLNLHTFTDAYLHMQNACMDVKCFISRRLFLQCYSDRSPVPVISAVQSNITFWSAQNLSNRFLNTATELTSTTKSGKLFHIFTIRAAKENFLKL